VSGRGFIRVGLLTLVLAIASPDPTPPTAQDLPATLLADRVTYEQETGLLVAEGSVEVLYRGRVLRAERLTYDQNADEIRVTGPIVLVDPETGVMLADAAALTPDLRTGLVEGARLLVADQLQLAAVEARRIDGRYAQLDRVIASTCTICAENPVPTWAVRASRVTQDPVAERIYFENATVEVYGLPIAWLPRLSIPDPAVRRASGFLPPEFSRSDIYGFSLRAPYYRVLGPSADLTFAPTLTTNGGVLIDGEYRRRMEGGGFDFFGVLALRDGLENDISPGGLRGAFSTSGNFRLEGDFDAYFDINLASDDDFLAQFDLSDADRLTSTVGVRRTRASDFLDISGTGFQSLLREEDTSRVPFILPELRYRRLVEDPVAGGLLSVDLAGLGVFRDVGRDVLRGGGGVDWRREWLLPRGVLAGVNAGAEGDVYRVWDDPVDGDQGFSRLAPTLGAEVRWPLVRLADGAEHVLEPIVQVFYTETLGDDDPPNEDSQLPEFDETNLFSPDRFPGRDRIERGLRANIGLVYTLRDARGWDLGVTVGRVLRDRDEDDFAAGSGLSGRRSDFVGALRLDLDDRISLVNRALFGSDFEFRRNEFGFLYDTPTAGLRATHVFLVEDSSNPTLGPQPETSEFAITGRIRPHPNWQFRADWRYDAVQSQNLRAGGGITYGNECAEFDVSVSRRFTSSDNVPASTTIGFGLRLAGLGAADGAAWATRVCAPAGLR
jgi:LPS-assembly protein